MERSTSPTVCVERQDTTEAPFEENGEQEVEPLKNGPEHTSEAESSDGVLTPALKESSTSAIQSKGHSYTLTLLRFEDCHLPFLAHCSSTCRAGTKEWEEAV